MTKGSTQNLLHIKQIKKGIIVLDDNSLRGIMMVSSINLALKSYDTQQAIINQFQSFLNSLDFSCQIITQTRRLNITGYIDKLKTLESKQTKELLRLQTREYRKFIESLVASGTIMNKTFYIIVPFYFTEMPTAKGLGNIFTKPSQISALTEENFNRGKIQLWQRMQFVSLGLSACGLTAAPLDTEEIIELFWAFYHPKEAELGYYPEVPPELAN